jgi:hypothetical protein
MRNLKFRLLLCQEIESIGATSISDSLTLLSNVKFPSHLRKKLRKLIQDAQRISIGRFTTYYYIVITILLIRK